MGAVKYRIKNFYYILHSAVYSLCPRASIRQVSQDFWSPQLENIHSTSKSFLIVPIEFSPNVVLINECYLK